MTDEQAAVELARETLARNVGTAHMRWCAEEREELARALLAISARHAAAMELVQAALAWRTGRDPNIVGTAPPGGQRSATGVALIEAIDAWRAGESK